VTIPLSFPPTSRYYGLETATREGADGQTIVYLRRRLVPPPERFTLLREHVVTEGERLDLLAATHIGDPLQWWRIADANRALNPEDLIEIGRRLRITLPEGIPGLPNA
jgi:hypothetical protein